MLEGGICALATRFTQRRIRHTPPDPLHMKRKHRNQIPDFSRKPKVDRNIPTDGKAAPPPQAPRVKPPATSSKSGRRGS